MAIGARRGSGQAHLQKAEKNTNSPSPLRDSIEFMAASVCVIASNTIKPAAGHGFLSPHLLLLLLGRINFFLGPLHSRGVTRFLR